MATNVNISAKYTIAHKYGLPVLNNNNFEHWEHELELWQLVTDLDVKKQAPVIYLSLNERDRQACAVLTKEELNHENGVKALLDKIRELYAKEKNQAIYEAYENLETYRRESDMNIRDYINEFERLNNKIKTLKEAPLPDPLLAYRLLKNANLSEDKRNLARATLPAFTYDNMKKQIKAIHEHVDTDKSTSGYAGNNDTIKVEPEDVFYGQRQYNRYRGGKPSYRGRGSYRGNERGYNTSGNRRYDWIQQQ